MEPNPKHEPVFVVVPKSGNNGTGLCQKSVILAHEIISVQKMQVFRAKDRTAGYFRRKSASYTVASRELVRQVPISQADPFPCVSFLREAAGLLCR